MSALTQTEASRLRDQETVIERGCKQIGEALIVIRDQRLYRAAYSTFHDYCQEKWGIGRNYANKQIAAAEVVAGLGTKVPSGLGIGGSQINERQARELAPLRDDPEQMRDVWQKANEATDGKPTAAAIREARGSRNLRTQDTDDDLRAALERHLDDDADYTSAKYRATLTRELARMNVTTFDVERVVEVADELTYLAIDTAFDNFARWHGAVSQQRRTLRVVKGGAL